ncbi:MAG: hypothetical protein ABJB34_09105 [Acidobacteriota bacterium]
MKVDMSPESITGRLRAMDDLWLLSVKLINSKLTGAEPLAGRRSRALEIQDSIRRVFFRDWDPLGINDYKSSDDEYDSYIAPVYRILVGSRSESDLIDTLKRIATDQMGIGAGSLEKLDLVAEKLFKLKVTLH